MLAIRGIDGQARMQCATQYPKGHGRYVTHMLAMAHQLEG